MSRLDVDVLPLYTRGTASGRHDFSCPMGFVIVLDRVQDDTCLHSKLSKSLPVMADRLKSVQEVGMASGKNNAGTVESPTSPHISRRNLEMPSEAAMFYAVIKGDDTNLSD